MNQEHQPSEALAQLGGQAGLDAIVKVVREAGQRALSLATEVAQGHWEKKSDESPVTVADREVESIIKSYLEKAHPHIAFEGEETGKNDTVAEWSFLLDPIDGTRSFLRGIPTWSTLLSLTHRGESKLGIAHFPADGDMLIGIENLGTVCNGKPVKLSSVAALKDATVSHGLIHQFTDDGYDDLLCALGKRTYVQRGFADFDGYRKLLLGYVDAMIEPGPYPWDLAPASVMVRAAGGRFSDFEGRLRIDGRSSVASNGLIHDELLALVREHPKGQT